jgi:hypothetical protein
MLELLMHAVVATVSVEDNDRARAALAELRVPLVTRARGLITGYWLEPLDGFGMSVLVFESRGAAEEALRHPLPSLPGVTPVSVQVREVYASI